MSGLRPHLEVKTIILTVQKGLLALIVLASFFSCSDAGKPAEKKSKRISDNNKGAENVLQPGQLKDSSTADSVIKSWTWSSFDKKVFVTQISFAKADVEKSTANRKKLTLSPLIKNAPDYGRLRSVDSEFLKPLAAQLKTIASNHKLNEQKTAELVITMVQNIPYTLVHPYSHEHMETIDKNSDGFIKKYHSEEAHLPLNMEPFGGCLDNIDPAGVLSPVEFLSTFKGDCDTRTVTIQSLLTLLDIPSIVVNGPGHSMLALPLKPENPAAPSLLHNGIKYYFLETTVFYSNNNGTGPRIGDVPANFDPQQWKPVLI
jgi:hypothetical protein